MGIKPPGKNDMSNRLMGKVVAVWNDLALTADEKL